MKSSKRIFALIMTLVFVLSSVSVLPAFAADFTDVDANNVHYEAITSLVEDGVINGYEDGTFKPENTITRAEFSKLLAVASAPRGTQFTATTTNFPDVADSASSSAWAIPYIAYAVGTGAINGYEDGTFRPTNTVTYGEAVKMIVCTLGYEPVVDKTLTPWYQGYLDISNQINLSKNAISLGDSPAPRALVAQLIYNMLDCKPLVQTGTDINGKPIYSTDGMGNTGGSSFGDSKDNAESKTGVLLGVFEYCLTGQTLKKSQALIDDTVYDIGDVSLESLKALVGYEVKYQYSTVNKSKLTKVTKESSNKLVKLEDWQIESVTADGIEYFADEDAEYDNKTSSMSFSKDFYVVYNGKPVDPSDIDANFIRDYLNVSNGSITFLSNDGSAKNAEVAFVESFTTYFVSSVSTSNGITSVYDKHPSVTGLDTLALDEYDVTSVKKITTKNGALNSSTLTGITKNAVLDIALPYGTNEGAYAYVSTVTVSGTVKEMSSDYEELKIGTESYEVSPYFRTLLDGGIDVSFEINDSGKFYLDYLGRITFFEKTDSSNPYGLLIRYKEGVGMDSGYQVEIMTASGSTVAYELKDKVKVNGTSMDNDAAIEYLKKSRSQSVDAATYPAYIIQPVRYATSVSSGKTVVSVIECMDPDNYDKGYIKPYAMNNTVHTGEKGYFAKGGTLKYSKTGYTFKNGDANQFNMSSSSTVVFVIPSDLTQVTKYKKYSSSYFSDGGSYAVEAYDVDKSTAGLVVNFLKAGQTTEATIGAATPVYFINSVGDVRDDDGNIVKNITYIKAGTTEEKTIKTDYDVNLEIFDTLKSGDIVKFAGNPITAMLPVYVDGKLSNSTGSNVNGNENFISKDYTSTKGYYQVITGTVYSLNVDENTLRVIPAFVDDEDFREDAYEAFNTTSSTVYYKYNTKTDAFETTTADEVKTYEEFADADVSQASTTVAIIMDKKVIAVYVLDK